ncbi:MAG: exodeoxyribonuclease III [Acidimicrobiales bacterium]
MRIASWNVDSIRARLPLVERWIDETRPDVLCLQETKVSDRAFPRAPFTERGYDVAVAGSGGYGGVAMMARPGLRRVQVGIPGARPPLAERRTVSADVDGLRIHTVYAPNGRKVGTRHHEVKLAWLELFRAWVVMDGLGDGRPTMVIGDLNIAPADIDVWEPARYRKRNLTSPAERCRFERLLGAGLVDLVRRHHGDEPVFTWWNRRGDFYESDRGWRLDHALADPATAARLRSVLVDRAERGRPGASDHAPLLVELVV